MGNMWHWKAQFDIPDTNIGSGSAFYSSGWIGNVPAGQLGSGAPIPWIGHVVNITMRPWGTGAGELAGGKEHSGSYWATIETIDGVIQWDTASTVAVIASGDTFSVNPNIWCVPQSKFVIFSTDTGRYTVEGILASV